jgi:hypothetical protein
MTKLVILVAASNSVTYANEAADWGGQWGMVLQPFCQSSLGYPGLCSVLPCLCHSAMSGFFMVTPLGLCLITQCRTAQASAAAAVCRVPV